MVAPRRGQIALFCIKCFAHNASSVSWNHEIASFTLYSDLLRALRRLSTANYCRKSRLMYERIEEKYIYIYWRAYTKILFNSCLTCTWENTRNKRFSLVFRSFISRSLPRMTKATISRKVQWWNTAHWWRCRRSGAFQEIRWRSRKRSSCVNTGSTSFCISTRGRTWGNRKHSVAKCCQYLDFDVVSSSRTLARSHWYPPIVERAIKTFYFYYGTYTNKICTNIS